VRKNTLEKTLISGRITAETRLELIQDFLNQPEALPSLLEMCYHVDSKAAFQAAWIFDGVLRLNTELLLPLWDRFVTQLEQTKNPSVLRSFAKICELVCIRRWKEQHPLWKKAIKEEHLELLAQNLFDWLIGPQKVAVKVFAMTGLYYLGEDVPWVNTELAAVIENQLPGSSAGFQNRGKKTIAALRKRKA